MNEEPVLLSGAAASDTRTGRASEGEFIAHTRRSPDRSGDNEDTVAIIPCGPARTVLVVADGAGGLPAGKRASLTAVAALAKELRTDGNPARTLRGRILDGIDSANHAVKELANGSATTLTAIAIEGNCARAYQIGDSEALVVGQRGRIRLQTTAHSPTGFAVEAGFLDQREALHHHERHLVSNFLGTPDMRIDIGAEVELQARDTLLVASDGLTDNVHLDEIIERIRKGPLADGMQKVITLARHRMSATSSAQPSKPDDLSLILFRRLAEKRATNLTNSSN